MRHSLMRPVGLAALLLGLAPAAPAVAADPFVPFVTNIPTQAGARDAIAPDVAYNPVSRQYLVAWNADDQPTDDENEVYAQRLDEDGDPLGDAMTISSVGPGADADRDAFRTAVAADPSNGGWIVVWSGDDATDNEAEIHAQRVAPTGERIGPDDLRVSFMGADGNAAFDAADPDVACAADGRCLVTWSGDNSVDNDSEIWGQIVTAQGGLSGGEIQLSSIAASGIPADNRVAYDPTTGGWLAAWTAPSPEIDREVYVQTISPAGGQVGGDTRVTNFGAPGNVQVSPSGIALAGNPVTGGFLVVASADATLNDDAELYARRIEPGGTPAAVPEARITTTGPEGSDQFDAQDPDVAADPVTGDWLVLYHGVPDLAFVEEVLAQRLTPAGVPVGPRANVSRAATGDTTLRLGVNPPALAAGDGQWLATWQLSVGNPGRERIMGSRLTPPRVEAAPAVSGTAAIGGTLTCDPGRYRFADPGPARQWLRGGSAIAGATGESYVPVAEDAGQTVACQVTAVGTGGDRRVTSAPVIVPPASGSGPAGPAGVPGPAGATGATPAIPLIAVFAPSARTVRVRRGRAVSATFAATAAGRVVVRVRRGSRTVRTITRSFSAGEVTARWDGRIRGARAAVGTYRVQFEVRTPGGTRVATRSITVRVRR